MMDDRTRASIPHWLTRTRGWEAAEDAAALFLYGALNRALMDGRYEDAKALRQEMSG